MEVSEEPKKLNTIIDDKKIIEQFISNNSYGFYQFNAIILSILILSIEAIFLSEISYLVIPLKEKYGENNFKLELCAAIVFIGQAIGSTLISYLLKFATRKTWILICLVFMCILQGILIFITTLFGLTLIRFFLGILLGATFPITINICCEYLPVTYRSFVMNSLYIGFSVGQLFMLIVMYYIMPNLEHKQIKIFMIYLFFYILLVTIIFFILIEDSPRNLILIGKLKQGIQIYKKMNKMVQLTEEQEKLVEIHVSSGTNSSQTSSYTSLFKTPYLKTTILLILIWTINSFIRYGPILIYESALKLIVNSDNKNIILSNMLTSFITIIFCIIFAAISELKEIGLIKITKIVFILALIFLILTLANRENLEFWMAVFSAIVNAGNASINTYTNLIYPTKIRDLSYGFLNSIKKVGAFFSQFMFLSLFKQKPILPYWLLLSLNIVIIIILFFLPIDPTNKELDKGPNESLVK